MLPPFSLEASVMFPAAAAAPAIAGEEEEKVDEDGCLLFHGNFRRNSFANMRRRTTFETLTESV
jgi:hypothetical protein